MGLSDIKFNLVETKSEAGKDYYVEGFISTTDPDLFNDVVTEDAQSIILTQLINQDITMDEDHDSHRDNSTGKKYDRFQNKIPAAKIEHAELRQIDDGSLGTWVRVKLNKSYPLFENLLDSIRGGFVHSFSIAYHVTESFNKLIGDKMHRFIENLNIFNVGLTGIPINSNAKFNLALKSFNKMDNEKELKSLQESVDSLTKENTELKSNNETKEAEVKSLGEKVSELESSNEEKSAEVKSVSDANTKELAELKSKVESIDSVKEEVAELKSLIEKLRAEPINGAEMKSQNNTVDNREISFTGLLGGNE